MMGLPKRSSSYNKEVIVMLTVGMSVMMSAMIRTADGEQRKDKSMVDANCPPGCSCDKFKANCTQSFTDTDIFLQFTELTYPSLDTLIIRDNHLEELEGTNLFGPNVQHRLLTKLDLTNNRISRIDARAFHGLPAVEELSLENNRIREITGDLFKNMPRITRLNLRHAFSEQLTADQMAQLLSHLFMDTQQRFARLKHLDLSLNAIVYPPRFLCQLTALETVNLSDNMMRGFELSKACLNGLTSLNLSNNGISHLDKNFSDLMDSSMHLEHVDLSENPFDCSCKLRQFIQWYQKSELPQPDSRKGTACADALPETYLQSTLDDIVVDNLLCPHGQVRGSNHTKYLQAIYVFISLALFAFIVLLVCILYHQKAWICKTKKDFSIGKARFHVNNSGYEQLGKEPEVNAEFV